MGTTRAALYVLSGNQTQLGVSIGNGTITNVDIEDALAQVGVQWETVGERPAVAARKAHPKRCSQDPAPKKVLSGSVVGTRCSQHPW